MEILGTIYAFLIVILLFQAAMFIIMLKGSSQEAGLKKRVAIKKLQLEEAMLAKQIKSNEMPTLNELVQNGILEVDKQPPVDGEGDSNPENRKKVGFK